MKTLDVQDATAPLATSVAGLEGEELTITHKGVPLAILRPAGQAQTPLVMPTSLARGRGAGCGRWAGWPACS